MPDALTLAAVRRVSALPRRAQDPALYKKLPFDPQKDFVPITLTGRFAIVLLVNTNKLKVNSVAELVEAAKKAPGAIDYASGGVGNPFHLASEMFAQAAQIKLNHIPYKGAAPDRLRLGELRRRTDGKHNSRRDTREVWHSVSPKAGGSPCKYIIS